VIRNFPRDDKTTYSNEEFDIWQLAIGTHAPYKVLLSQVIGTSFESFISKIS